jgi:hypothetical protein
MKIFKNNNFTMLFLARALELKKQEDYKLVQMMWTMKKEMVHEKFSMDWAPSCNNNFFLFVF